ncbi:SDR family oxidoreductase [Fodinicola feengrottensis]|uniref:3-dehydrosphinganine reductase n=1 Tax=Fodinicola feengrottensis TaxID=435914 RepID=A0ABN2IXH8_9ACTN|nr:SDR family oxidoreductase [Fodinicola feengrottensis]
MPQLSGAHAVITGGSSGIGLATAHAFVRRGATVSLMARGSERLEAAAAQLRQEGATVATAAVDVSDADAVRAAVKEVTAAQGPCDVLVASAGQARPGRFLELDDAIFRDMVEVDYFGVYQAIRAVVPSMVERRRGSIVAISSAAALVGIYGYSAYGPAKFAVRGLMESLRGELKPHGVHVGCVFPPDVDTPQLVEENQWKPAETAAISGTIKPIHPDRVALAIARGIERNKFAVYPDAGTAAIARLIPLAGSLWRRFEDSRIRSVTRK